jgi:23S rRNA pseudouridine2605 synthase
VASRRAAESLIAAGRVRVNGQPVTQPGSRVRPGVDRVEVDGRQIAPAAPRVYYLLNKPRDVLCTARDPAGRRTVHDLVGPMPQRIFTIGRLDRNSEGLLLLTNDGALAEALTHPRHQVIKTYQVWLPAPLTAAQEQQLLAGLLSEGDRLRAVRVRGRAREGDRYRYEIDLAEGKNRQIRRMMEALGTRVHRLLRTALGPLSLGPLRRGAWRPLAPAEVDALRRAAGVSGNCG